MKRGATKVAVVIPAWNDAAALRISLSQLQALDASVLDQLEVIVADGASTDETLSVLASFASIVTHVDSQADGGVYEAINRGVSRVSAPWVWVLGAGDTPMATDFRRALDVLSKTEDNVAHAFAVASDGAPEPGVPEMWIPRWKPPGVAQHHAPSRPHCTELLVEIKSVAHLLPSAWRLRVVP